MARYQTQPAHNLQKEYFKINRQLAEKNYDSNNDHEDVQVDSKKYNTTDGVLDVRECSQGVKRVVSPIQVDTLRKP